MQIVMTYTTAREYICEKYRNIEIDDHPLYTPGMICIEGVAAVVRGDLLPIHTDKEKFDMTGKLLMMLI